MNLKSLINYSGNDINIPLSPTIRAIMPFLIVLATNKHN